VQKKNNVFVLLPLRNEIMIMLKETSWVSKFVLNSTLVYAKK